MPDSDNLPSKPRDRKKAVQAAFWRLQGATQKDAAKAADLGERTLRQYEACDWWPDIQMEALEQWGGNVMAKVLKALEALVDIDRKDGPDPSTTKYLADRLPLLQKLLRKEADRLELTGKDGGPFEVVERNPREVLAEKLNAIAEREGEHE